MLISENGGMASQVPTEERLAKHSPDEYLSEAEHFYCQSSVDTDRQYGGEDACHKEKSLNEKTDSLTIPLNPLSPSLTVPKHPPSPTAARKAMTGLTPVSHALTDRMTRTAAYTVPHVTAEQHRTQCATHTAGTAVLLRGDAADMPSIQHAFPVHVTAPLTHCKYDS